MSSSIIIKKGPTARIPGVFPSVRFGEQVVSTGIPSLDSYIGGGIPLGTICIIKDNFPSRYGDLILKCFVAEGASYNHHTFISSGKVPPRSLADQLPCLKKSQGPEEFDSSPSPATNRAEKDDIKIAWRYSKVPNTGGGVVKGQKEAKFIFTKKTSFEELGGQHLSLWDPLDDTSENNPQRLSSVFSELSQAIFKATDQFEIDPSNTRPVSNLCRIALSHCEETSNSMFLKNLRSIVRHTNSCALIILSDQQVTTIPEHFSDTVIQLDAIVEDKRKIELGDVDGLLRVTKMDSVKSLKPILPPSDIGFSFRRSRLTFMELSIPPEGETSTQREVSSSSKSTGCGTIIKGKPIDF